MLSTPQAPIKTLLRGCFPIDKDHTQTKPHFTPVELHSKHSTTIVLELPLLWRALAVGSQIVLSYTLWRDGAVRDKV